MTQAQHGLWTVLDQTGRKWLCRCRCGTERAVIKADVLSGRSAGCGCTRHAAAGRAAAAVNTTHGMDGTPAYRRWIDMKRRCHDPRRPDFKNYGARGIAVCDRWRESFTAYFADVGDAPGPGYTLDRIENDGDYEPGNVRWVERGVQERNKRSSRWLTIDGEKMTMAEAAERFAIGYHTLTNRICTLGWPDERAVREPVRRRTPIKVRA